MGVRAQVGHMLVHWGCTLASALTDLNAPATPGHTAAGYTPVGRHGYTPAVLRDTWLQMQHGGARRASGSSSLSFSGQLQPA